MGNDEASESLKAEIRRLANLVHERMLRSELETLEAQFVGWRCGEMDSFHLLDAIHRFHAGPSSMLLSRFNTNMLSQLTGQVRNALQTGVLAEHEVQPEALTYLRSAG